MRDSFVFYRSFYESIKRLPPEDFKNCFLAITEYALNGTEPETEGIERTVFELIKPQIDSNNQRYENGKKGGRPKNQEKPNDNQVITKNEPNETKGEPNVYVYDNDIKKKDTNVSKEKATRFIPPTLDEIRAYVAEKKYNVEPEKFLDFYESKGWMVGKNKMKDWKAAVRNWSRSQRQEVTTKASKFSNFSERQYSDADYKSLIQM